MEWSKDKTQAAESIKWRPQQAYGSEMWSARRPGGCSLLQSNLADDSLKT